MPKVFPGACFGGGPGPWLTQITTCKKSAIPVHGVTSRLTSTGLCLLSRKQEESLQLKKATEVRVRAFGYDYHPMSWGIDKLSFSQSLFSFSPHLHGGWDLAFGDIELRWCLLSRLGHRNRDFTNEVLVITSASAFLIREELS